ncbi:B3/4 domain-containing protein [Magnetospira sp. QH-2]|uniref:B3/B4 domain-containing protein n=1 Tax=Magnetospira sp. (strain QH-2) TaxID=1288970 RepID=UPI0003E81C03|nr:phenylalanine--tRNA ligase beta subunit-related protein [Magnetospira sp. QH-2]CCQ73489.1 Conserved protein of unknown function [Magnetospira sp. QH-2]
MSLVSIAEDFAARQIAVSLGCLRCQVRVAETHPDLEKTLLDHMAEAHNRIAATPIAEWPAIQGTRRAYKALGKDPARYRPSAEALLRRIKSGKDLYRINTVVDVTNLISIRTGFSIGTYDLSKVAAPISFRRAGEGETYAGIGRGPLNLEGLPVFADQEGPFGSPTSDSERTCISMETRDLLMVLIGFGDQPTLREAMGHAVGALELFCGTDGVAVTLVTGGAS